MRILLIKISLLLFLSSANGQIADIDLVALQQFKVKQSQNLERFKQDQENALEKVKQQQILTHLLEQVEHQKALLLQLVGVKQIIQVAQVAQVEQDCTNLWPVPQKAQSVQKQILNSDLAILNRARKRNGLYAYRYDPSLTKVASERANRQANRGRMSHVGGSYRPGKAEGVSMSTRGNPITNACFAMSRKYRVAGAACVKGRNGKTYCSLVLR